MKVGRALKLVLLGACAPVIGLLFCLIQLNLNPHGVVVYNLVQIGMSMLYTSLFAALGWHFSAKGHTKWDKLFFFAVPILLIVAEQTILYNCSNLVNLIILGVNAPFFAFWIYVYYIVSPFAEVATVLPTALCFLAFLLGEKAQQKKKGGN